MDENQKDWSKRYWSHLGPREFLRIVCAIALWNFLGITLSIVFKADWIYYIFLALMIILAIMASISPPAYSIYRKILGNENLPIEPMPRRVKLAPQPRKWWSYLPGVWWILIDLVLLFAVLKWLLK